MSTVIALVYLFRKPVHLSTWGQLSNIVGLSEKRECWALYTWNVEYAIDGPVCRERMDTQM